MSVKLEITEEIAERIINSRVLIEEALVPYKGVEVSYVGFVDSEGNPFLWEDSEEPYAIVSFKATNEHQLMKAVELFEAGEFEEATNTNMSMRMNVDKARELIVGGLGSLICHEVEVEDENGDNAIALLPKKFVPAEAKVAKKVSLADLLAKKAGKAVEAKAEAKIATGVPADATE